MRCKVSKGLVMLALLVVCPFILGQSGCPVAMPGDVGTGGSADDGADGQDGTDGSDGTQDGVDGDGSGSDGDTGGGDGSSEGGTDGTSDGGADGDNQGDGGSGSCPALTGTGTNPGSGEGSFELTVTFSGDGGQVTLHPVLSGIGNTTLALGPGGEQTLTFSSCPEQVDLGAVSFEDASGSVTDAGQVTLTRGTDYACGQAATLSCSLPCGMTLELP